MSDQPDVDTLVATVREMIGADEQVSGIAQLAADSARAALSDLAARARKADEQQEWIDRVSQTSTDAATAAEAAEADRDRLQERYDALVATIQGKTMFDVVAEKVDTEIRADRLARRITELKAALQRIADADGLTIPGHDTTATYARSVLAGDGEPCTMHVGCRATSHVEGCPLSGDGGGA